MGGRISWVARSGGDGRTLRGLNLIGQKNFGTPFGGEAGCVEPRRKFDPSLQTYGKVKGRIGCNGSQRGVRKKLESKLENQHPSSRGKPWP
ncbi:hypothetical protein TIFTF001_046382 [Ficus carica]|uniref:Uncharacterized protein n=1 Tax=Ficus carica TaxID=3494 RepID=A0AA88CPR3_FICCA|nr:hypothetical protein TIFTF001_046382 [Ficus carica]